MFQSLIRATTVSGKKSILSRRHLKSMFEKKSPPVTASDEEVFSSLLTWPVWVRFLDVSGMYFYCTSIFLRINVFFCVVDKVLTQSGDDFVRQLTRAKTVLGEYVQRIVSGAVTVEQLHFMSTNEKKLLKLCSKMDLKADGCLEAKAKVALKSRREEFKAFQNKEALVKHFVGTCQNLGSGRSF